LAVLEVESGLIPGLKQDVYISWIGTFEEFRTKGYASELLSNIIDNSSNVGLTVFYKNTRAISLYKKFGFSVCNRINYPDGETDLVMHKLVKYHTG
jgi:ribosomal protein S18 acetylase RimI-like enzyme